MRRGKKRQEDLRHMLRWEGVGHVHRRASGRPLGVGGMWFCCGSWCSGGVVQGRGRRAGAWFWSASDGTSRVAA